MTWLALSLYLLGIPLAVSAARWDIAPGIRETTIVIVWPVTVLWAVAVNMITGFYAFCRARSAR